jgi:transposase
MDEAEAPKRGRPTLLTDEVEERILRAIRAGNFRGTAAQWAGIGERTLRDWMKRGEEDEESREGLFRLRLLEAEQSAEIRMVGLISKAAEKDPKHAQWWLERKHPDRWGRKDRLSLDGRQQLEVTGAQGGPLRAEVSNVHTDEGAARLANVVQLLSKLGALPLDGAALGAGEAADASADEVHPSPAARDAGGVPPSE